MLIVSQYKIKINFFFSFFKKLQRYDIVILKSMEQN